MSSKFSARMASISLWWLLVGCASLPPPEALTVARERENLSETQAAKALAPQAFAHAKQLRERADLALDDGDRQTAEILAEHSLAAYQHALVQSRLVRAKQRIDEGRMGLAKAERELAALTAAQQQTEAHAKALELRARVARDAEPLEPIERAGPAREAARKDAAMSIIEGARLLCLSARMLDSDAKDVQKLTGDIDALDRRLQGNERPTPIGEAMSLRTACLSALTLTRRQARQAAPEEDPADVLLVQLQSALPDGSPIRDDRGITLSSTNVFANGKTTLTEQGKKLLGKVVDIAKANPMFPLLAVVHGPEKTTASQTSTLQAALKGAGLESPTVHDTGSRLPLAVQPVVGAPAEAPRVEFVFVAPQ